MTFLGLIARNIASRPLRAALTGAAVAIGVMSVLALGVLTSSLKATATELLQVGSADFTIAQKNTNDIINSTIPSEDITAISKMPGVGQAIGALIATNSLGPDFPLVIQIGLAPADQKPFGVDMLDGTSYQVNSKDQVMLGYVLAKQLGKTVGDTVTWDKHTYKVVGLYRTNISFGNSTMMMSLSQLQANLRLSGQVSLGFVKLAPGASKQAVRTAIASNFRQLTTLATATEYGQADRNLTLITAANTGGSILAGLIAITGVLNTSLLSFFERLREYGICRSVGWSRRRVISLVLGESFVVSLVGAVVGITLGWGAVNVLQHLPALRGIFSPAYNADVFLRSLLFGVAVAFIGALYPALRAASVAPMAAVRRE